MNRTIEEQYTSAVQAKSLAMSDHQRGAPDILIASSWAKADAGRLIVRLLSEYSSIPKKSSKVDLTLLAMSLRTLPEVRALVEKHKRMEKHPDKLGDSLRIILWWLDKTCKACDGRKYEVVANTPKLSERHCKHCQGTGETKIPMGEDGKNIANWMDDCVSAWRQKSAKVLR